MCYEAAQLIEEELLEPLYRKRLQTAEEVLCVSRSGYYAWQSRPESRRSRENKELLSEITKIHEAPYKGCYGSPRVHRQLQKDGIKCGRHRVARLMRKNEIQAKGRRKFKLTTDSSHQRPVAPNILAREFEATAPNQKWCWDITYIWTEEGWLYLAVILDLYSRMVIGWSMMPRMTSDLVCTALRMAIVGRLPFNTPLMHADRGSQYASEQHQRILSAFNINCSMSRSGDCWDNSVLESFFATLKTECVYQFSFASRDQARKEIFDYMEIFYNRQRLHSTLDYLSPAEFEELQVGLLSLAA